MGALQNVKHELFAQALSRGEAQAKAYALAGYIENASNACQLAQRQEIQARVIEINIVRAARADVTADRVLAELARIAFADISQLVTIRDGRAVFTETAQLTPDQRAAIAEISETRDGVKVKLHDKVQALEKLGKHLGLFKENINLDIDVSLADLVTGSYKLKDGKLVEAEAKDITPPADKVQRAIAKGLGVDAADVPRPNLDDEPL